MKKILAALALLVVATPALASTKKPSLDSAYGIVRTLCMGADLPGQKPGNGCEAWLDSAGKSIKLNGNFTKIAKFNGKMVEVKGIAECLNGGGSCAFAVKSIKAVAAEPLPVTATTGSATARDAQTTGGSVALTPSSTSGGGTTR